jgi:hypothetical protein
MLFDSRAFSAEYYYRAKDTKAGKYEGVVEEQNLLCRLLLLEDWRLS